MKWEYHTVRLNHTNLSVEELNEIGKQGFELVSVFKERGHELNYVFKRPLVS